MGVTITGREEQAHMPWYKLDRKLWLNADKTAVVEDGDPAARFLLGSAGHEITMADAEKYGLTGAPEAAAEPADEPEAAEDAAPKRKRTAPEEDKSIKPEDTENK